MWTIDGKLASTPECTECAGVPCNSSELVEGDNVDEEPEIMAAIYSRGIVVLLFTKGVIIVKFVNLLRKFDVP